MKKLVFLFAVSMFSTLCGASNYRGMFEIGGGPVFANETIRTSTGQFKNKQTSFGGIFSTEHGCQIIPWLFAGAGVGVICDWIKVPEKDIEDAGSYYSSKKNLITIPLFMDVRWDLDVNKKITPYADIRLGYQLGMEGLATYKATSVTNPSVITTGLMKTADGMFVQATAGVRWKVAKNTGINLGISFIPFLKRKIMLESTIRGNRSLLLLNAGIDIQGTGNSTTKEDRKAKLYRLQQRKLKQQSKSIIFE